MARFGSDTRYPNEYNIVNEALDPMSGSVARGPGALMGGDAFSQSVIEDMLMGRGDQYSPGGLDAGEMFPEEQMTPDDFIRMQLAGDVVPLPLMKQMNAVDRMSRTDAPYYMSGQQTIRGLGGQESPYLDLLNILAFPGGGSMAPSIRRR